MLCGLWTKGEAIRGDWELKCSRAECEIRESDVGDGWWRLGGGSEKLVLSGCPVNCCWGWY